MCFESGNTPEIKLLFRHHMATSYSTLNYSDTGRKTYSTHIMFIDRVSGGTNVRPDRATVVTHGGT